MHDIIIWTILGIVLMMLEIFGIPGIGILFTGFSAITVSIFLYTDPTLNGNMGLQLLYFFIFTAIWGGILWLPLKAYIHYGKEDDFKNIIGTFGTVKKRFERGQAGTVTWSGTTLRAFMTDDNPNEFIEEKTRVRIVDMVDGVIYVTENVKNDDLSKKSN